MPESIEIKKKLVNQVPHLLLESYRWRAHYTHFGKSPSVIFSQAQGFYDGATDNSAFRNAGDCRQADRIRTGDAAGVASGWVFAPGSLKTAREPRGYNKRLIFNRFYKTNLE